MGERRSSIVIMCIADRMKYRRPSYAQYEAPDVVGDVAIGYAAYPKTLKL
jgi:hypothetical protein